MAALSVRLHAELPGEGAFQLPVCGSLKVLNNPASLGLGQSRALRCRAACHFGKLAVQIPCDLLAQVLFIMVVVHIPALDHFQDCLVACEVRSVIRSQVIRRQRIHPVLTPLAKLDQCNIQLLRNLPQDIVSCAVAAVIGELARSLIVVAVNPVTYRAVRGRRHNDRNAAALQDAVYIIIPHQRLVSRAFPCFPGVDAHVDGHIVAGADCEKHRLQPCIIIIYYRIVTSLAVVSEAAEYVGKLHQLIRRAVTP